ncbi:hypothetical protein TIFTF001_002434 [Ficus carica]|uniref:Uncharacterized protein n=1 Tax=Ficus carica TaxID=3494 RepID=A0AA87ZAW4_FICCA|nr:hypothetical protein TIFTF001_002434 [Ficus carica]
MARFGRWGYYFRMTWTPLRWLATFAAWWTYLSCEQAGLTVTVAMSTHFIVSCCHNILTAYARAPSKITNFDEFKRFFFSLPELQIWETATTALVVAIVTTFFWPRDIVVWPISSYIAGFYGYPVFLAFRWTSRRGGAAIMRIIEALRTIRSNTPLNK